MTIEFGEVNRYDQSGQFPAVDLIFTGPKKSLVDRVSGNSLQFTRNTIGTYVDANGIIQTAAAGEPRYTYDPVTGEELGLLVEEARTNYITYSEDIGQWTKFVSNGNPLPIVSSGFTSPAGDSTAWRFQGNRSTGSGLVRIVAPVDALPNPHTVFYSIWLKSNTESNQTVKLFLATAGLDATVTPEWQRFYTGPRTATTTSEYIALEISSNTTQDCDVLVWGAQLEVGSFPTSYIPTSGSTVSRDPDTVTLTNDNIYNNSQFDIINDPFGMSAGSNTLTLLPSNSANSAIKRATIFSSNITQTKINTFAKKTDEFWRWRVLGSSFGLPNFLTDGQVTVDWGDGTVETLTTSDHTFTNGGGYHDIGFRLDSGTYFRPTIGGNAAVGDKIYSVGPAPESMKVNATQLFWNCDNLKSVDATFDIVNSANSAFYLCDNLKNIPKVNTTGITDFTNFARECSSLTSFPLIDTSSGTNFIQTWMNCSGLTTFPLLDTSSSTDFRNAWQGCSGLTTFPSLNLSSGTRFDYAWAFCSSLTDFPANLFDNCTTPFLNFAFNNTWEGCSLTPTSVENILNSISVSASSGTPPASGTDITISYNASSGTPDITVPAVDLIAKGWVPTLNGSAKNNAYSSDFATLDLDFATNLSLTDNISGNNLVTFSRDSIGTYVDSNGVIQTATANTPRFDHDPDTLESLGLLVEESRTNLIIYSENFDTATTSWYNIYSGTGQVPVITPNAAVSPDGTTNATQIDFDVTGGSTGGDVSFIAQAYSANATDYTLSAWIKADSNFNIIFESNTGATNIVSVTTEWQRVSYVKLNASGTRQVRIGLRADRPVPQSATIYIWGAQLEQGSFPTSYIPNNGTPGGIIRAADVASISGTDLTSWFNQSEGTFRVRGRNDLPVSAGNAGAIRFMSLSTGPLVYQDTTYNFSSNSANYGAVFGIRAENGSNNNFYGNIGWTNTFPTQNYVGSYNSTSSTIGYNNVSRTESFNFTLQSDLSHMWIGRMHNFGPNRNHIGRISYWPKKLTDKSIKFLSQ